MFVSKLYCDCSVCFRCFGDVAGEYVESLFLFVFQIGEEVAKLLELKAQLGSDGVTKYILKTPKVTFFMNVFTRFIIGYFLHHFFSLMQSF